MYEYYYYYYRSSGICRDKLIINNFSTKFSEILSLLCKNHNLSTNDKVILINNRKVELDEEISKYIEKKSIKIIIGTMSGYIRNEKNRLMIEAQKYVLILLLLLIFIRAKRISKGDSKITPNNRIYYAIKYDNKIYSIFCDKKYTVGKIIDYFCKLFGIINLNAKGTGYCNIIMNIYRKLVLKYENHELNNNESLLKQMIPEFGMIVLDRIIN